MIMITWSCSRFRRTNHRFVRHVEPMVWLSLNSTETELPIYIDIFFYKNKSTTFQSNKSSNSSFFWSYFFWMNSFLINTTDAESIRLVGEWLQEQRTVNFMKAVWQCPVFNYASVLKEIEQLYSSVLDGLRSFIFIFTHSHFLNSNLGLERSIFTMKFSVINWKFPLYNVFYQHWGGSAIWDKWGRVE